MKHALTLYHKGHYEEAITFLLNDFGKHEPRHTPPEHAPQAMALLARLYANLGRLNDSLKWCQQAIAHDKVNAGYHFLQSTIHQERGELDAAREALRRTLFLDQTFVIAHFAMGNVLRTAGKTVEARRHFTNALGLLNRHAKSDVLPESDGLTVARLKELVESILGEMEGTL